MIASKLDEFRKALDISKSAQIKENIKKIKVYGYTWYVFCDF